MAHLTTTRLPLSRVALICVLFAGATMLSGCMQPSPVRSGAEPRPGLSADRVAVNGDEEVIPATGRAPEYTPHPTPPANMDRSNGSVPGCSYRRVRNDAAGEYRVDLFLTVPQGYPPGPVYGSYRIFSDDFSPGIAPPSPVMVTTEGFQITARERAPFQNQTYQVGQREVRFPAQLTAVEATVTLSGSMTPLRCVDG